MKKIFLSLMITLVGLSAFATTVNPQLIACVGAEEYKNALGYAGVEITLEQVVVGNSVSYKLFGILEKSNTLSDLIVNETDLTCKFAEKSFFESDTNYLFSCENAQKGLRLDLIKVESVDSVYFQLRKKLQNEVGSKALVNFSHGPNHCVRRQAVPETRKWTK